MTGQPPVDWGLLPIGLGLLGFVEPCSIGSTLILIKAIEGRSPAAQLSDTLLFALTRALFLGLLGALSAAVGTRIFGFQHAGWAGLGAVYLLIGVVYLSGRAGWLMRSIGPHLGWLASRRGAAGLGILFGLNVPACAVPLLGALLSSAALGGMSAVAGFVALALFGFALSLPLIAVVWFDWARSWLDRLAALSRSLPAWIGLAFVVLGAWSIWSAIAVPVAIP